MGMLIAWDNKADAATLSDVGSQLASLPGTNVQQPHLSLKWTTASGVTTSYIVFDLLSSLSCALLAVLGTTLTAAATMRLRASDANAGAVPGDLYDSGVIAAGVKDGYGAIYKAFAAVAARYWRLDLTDASLAAGLQVGRVFLGPSWAPSVGPEYGWAVTAKDASKVGESYGGQSYPEIRPQARVLEFTLTWETEAAMYDNAFALARANGVVKDVLAIRDINGAYLSEQSVWGLCSASKPISHRTSQSYQQQFTIKERR